MNAYPRLILPAMPAKRRRHAGGFSLIEMVLAVAVVVFALLPMVALLQVGLSTMQDSMNQTVIANIAQQIRGEFQQISFSSSSTDPVTINNLSSQVDYFTADGIETTTPNGPSNPAYYQATFSVSGATMTTAGATYTSANARMVTVTLSSPCFAPASSQKITLINVFVARQLSSD